MKERLTIPVPTRFPIKQVKRMDIAVEKTGLGSRSTLIKYIVNMFLNDFERRGMDALPNNWGEMLSALDGRHTRYEREHSARDYFDQSITGNNIKAKMVVGKLNQNFISPSYPPLVTKKQERPQGIGKKNKGGK